VTGLDQMIRELIREEVRRLIRPDALAANEEIAPDERDLHRRALEAATRFRRARTG
jgi:hypothetical protein